MLFKKTASLTVVKPVLTVILKVVVAAVIVVVDAAKSVVFKSTQIDVLKGVGNEAFPTP